MDYLDRETWQKRLAKHLLYLEENVGKSCQCEEMRQFLAQGKLFEALCLTSDNLLDAVEEDHTKAMCLQCYIRQAMEDASTSLDALSSLFIELVCEVQSTSHGEGSDEPCDNI